VDFDILKFDEWDKDWTRNMAKSQSIICVDIIIEQLKSDDFNSENLKFWLDVKEEISKL
jgi:hypothetical protein